MSFLSFSESGTSSSEWKGWNRKPLRADGVSLGISLSISSPRLLPKAQLIDLFRPAGFSHGGRFLVLLLECVFQWPTWLPRQRLGHAQSSQLPSSQGVC
mmetsp:Transcript_41634/g.93222  ORF Transcript_41634/g.93222 Transcript_41634/m.93222 type:complete len:99 (-) Transcript_41634:9-305(-)